MNASFTKAFNKQFKKLPAKQQAKAQTAVILFLEHPEAPSLRNHVLTGEWSSYRFISAGGDLRLHFKLIDDSTVLFVAVGTHSHLYK